MPQTPSSGVLGRSHAEEHDAPMAEIPGPWQTYAGGQAIWCDGQKLWTDRRTAARGDRRAEDRGAIPVPGHHRHCGRSILHVGKGKLIRIRIVGTRDIRVATDVLGSTIRCSCQTIYEFVELDLRKARSA
jgi:hypothetical protein